ncbi:DUF3180 domain-containing protein [Schaalia sp. 19OD2882]|uniref:DUF3180 domain-containing protein n=1 Tax=Schaalia sp. 19OD2882 TaxID=2794089 RepID=UPI001C1E9182|nr:DUF3180 domain-containing protein [Schaalia sp. 19OD2882]QWW19862.1 DUF3180 domain-containing protein [Schaalia sp. 19OD2882]
MKPVAPVLLVVIAVVTGATSGLATAVVLSSGGTPTPPTPFMSVLFVMFALVLVWLGLHVKRLRAHKETWMRPLGAARVAALARASAWVGSLMTGALGGLAAVCLTRMQAQMLVHAALWAGLAAVSALGWGVCAVIVERWCIVDTSDPDSDDERGLFDDASTSPA